MTLASFTAVRAPGPSVPGSTGTGYQPGVCNIGPAEIARRRRAGDVGLLATVVLLAILVAIGAPPLLRLLVGLPAAGSAVGYLQAWLRFCAGFATRGTFNFGPLGGVDQVADPESLSRDRRRATQIALASLAIGIAVGIVAALLPL